MTSFTRATLCYFGFHSKYLDGDIIRCIHCAYNDDSPRFRTLQKEQSERVERSKRALALIMYGRDKLDYSPYNCITYRLEGIEEEETQRLEKAAVLLELE